MNKEHNADTNYRLKILSKYNHEKKDTTTRKPKREKVWLKYNKHCAYCGKDLEYKDMQIDHLYPKTYGGNDDFINLMPSCRRCNHYKRTKNLEQFRLLIKTLHERTSDQYITKVAIDYGIVKIKPFDGIFYFEKARG